MTGNKDNTIKRKLYEELRSFYKNKEFVLAIGSNVTNDEDMQTVIDFINQGNKPTPEEVLLLSIELDQRRHPEDYIWEDK